MPKKKAKSPAKSAKKLSAKEAKHLPFWPFGLLIFSILLFIDQFTKNAIISSFPLNQPHPVISGLWFTYVQNTGTNWGLFQGINEIMIWLSIIIFGLLLYFYEKFETTIEKICFSLILVGLWGNLLDRGMHGFVVDFIDLGWFPIFNIADSCITVAVVVLLLEQWRKSRSSKNNI